MADLALGMAKTTVTETISRVKAAIEEEEKLKKGVKRDLMLISDEFELMNSFLKVAQEHDANDIGRTLVRQIRNSALDVEDCIQGAMHLDNKPHWWPRMLPFFLPKGTAVEALNQIAADIELLKTRIEAMGERKTRYNDIDGTFTKRSQDAVGRPAESKALAEVRAALQDAMHRTAASDALAEVRAALQDAMDRTAASDPEVTAARTLTELITADQKPRVHSPQVVAVWDKGGDQRSIIKKAYESQEISRTFKCRAWFQPRDLRDFREHLQTEFQKNCTYPNHDVLEKQEGSEWMTKEELNKVNKRHFRGRASYLVVLENLSSMPSFGNYLPDWKNSCIVVHTKNLNIANSCVRQSCQDPELRVSKLKLFPADYSVNVWALFKDRKTELIGLQKNFVPKFIDVAFEGLKVVPVWGIPGVGKSCIVKNWYENLDPNTKKGWVDVSHPFNLAHLSCSILIDLMCCNESNTMLGIKDLTRNCRELLYTHKCYVVIDGLKSTEEWDKIKAALEPEKSKSRIVVITTEESVAKYCASNTEMVLNVTCVEAGEATDIFKHKVEGGGTIIRNYPPEIEPMCGALPKVIVAVADFLASESKNGEYRFDNSCRMLMRDHFMDTMRKNQVFKSSLGDLFTWVDRYFRNCPDDLKPCIFYLSLFPMNCIIRRRRLARRWIAEGYTRATTEVNEENKAMEFMSKLVQGSMIHQLEVTNLMRLKNVSMPLYQVNGFFREYIMAEAMEENLVFSLEGRRARNSQCTGRHLAIHDSWTGDKKLFDKFDFSRLRSLTVFGKWRPFLEPKLMRLLRVIDLENSTGLKNKDLEKMLKWLTHLKFLSIRGCKEITRLPGSLGGLRQLQTLDVRDTSVAVLPSTIIQLRKLEYVRAGTTVPSGNSEVDAVGNPPFFRCRPADARGVRVPAGIGKQSTLHTLGVVNINCSTSGGVAILKNLKKNLSQLQKLGVCGVNQRNSQKLCFAISAHGHLKSLSVYFDKDNQAGCLNTISEPPKNLQSLKLFGLQAGMLPVWITFLKLRKLNLQMAGIIPQHDIDVLRNLEKLQILCLGCNCKENHDHELRFGQGFNQLSVLKIDCKFLNDVRFDGEMGNVEILKIRCSRVLEISGLKNLCILKKILLIGSYGEAFKQLLQTQLDKLKMKTVLKEKSQWN